MFSISQIVCSYLETVLKLLADKVEGDWVNAGV